MLFFVCLINGALNGFNEKRLNGRAPMPNGRKANSFFLHALSF